MVRPLVTDLYVLKIVDIVRIYQSRVSERILDRYIYNLINSRYLRAEGYIGFS